MCHVNGFPLPHSLLLIFTSDMLVSVSQICQQYQALEMTAYPAASVPNM